MFVKKELTTTTKFDNLSKSRVRYLLHKAGVSYNKRRRIPKDGTPFSVERVRSILIAICSHWEENYGDAWFFSMPSIFETAAGLEWMAKLTYGDIPSVTFYYKRKNIVRSKKIALKN